MGIEETEDDIGVGRVGEGCGEESVCQGYGKEDICEDDYGKVFHIFSPLEITCARVITVETVAMGLHILVNSGLPTQVILLIKIRRSLLID